MCWQRSAVLTLPAWAGVFLAGAAHGVPVVMDGFISCVAALLAARIAPFAKDYMIASHVSKEPAAHLLLAELGKEAFLHCDMCLGEGTGAIMLFPIPGSGKCRIPRHGDI